ncbi:MAG TPA: hypothetical protein ENI86_13575 [Acidimicrobiales bacterium]|nr:hypothetical protein [Acidimicrobiales bacterium]
MPTKLVVYDLLDQVQSHAWAMLESQSIEHLHTFWLATLAVARNTDLVVDYGEPDFRHFGYWLAARSGDGLNNAGWPHFLKDEDHPYAAFFELLAEFRKHRLVLLDTMQLSPPLPVPWTTKRMTGDALVEVPKQSIQSLSLANYGPFESCYLILGYTSGEVEHRWVWTEARAVEFLRDTLAYSGPTTWGTLVATASSEPR